MKRILVVSIVLVFAAGCNGLRFGPTEQQKENAWLHNRTAAMAAEAAKAEGGSDKLQAITKLSEVQSRAFVAYTGLPEEFPKADTAEDVLSDSSVNIAREAISDSGQRPDVWSLADSGLELAIAICGLAGGVYGTKAVGFLRDARAKSQALKEIIQGNELFKKANTASVEAFKAAQQNQSSETRQIVTAMKS